MKKYIMTIDAGTTSNRCIIFNNRAEIVSMAQKELPQTYPKPGWVEQNPQEIFNNQVEVCKSAIKKANIKADEILGIGITNQRETTIVWDKISGEPVYNAIVWQCRRTSQQAKELIDRGYGDFIKNRTGLYPDAYFSATKIAWILDNVPNAREKAESGELLFGTVDSWILYNLTGGVHITDFSNASRTMLYNIKELKWDYEIMKLLNIPKELLPEVKATAGEFAHTQKHIFGSEIPVLAMVGDQQSALFGQLCFEEGEAKNTYGTGAFILMNTGEKPVFSEKGLIATIFYAMDNKVYYALEGSIFVAGSAVQWLRDELGLISFAAQSEEAANSVEDCGGAQIVPAFTGLGAPYWKQDVRGTIMGITRGVNKNHIIRATLESIAFLSNDVLNAMESESHTKLKSLKVDGGASENNFLMQFQSNITDVEIIRPKSVESTALGACFLAGLQGGMWENIEELKSLVEVDKKFISEIFEVDRIKKLRQWKKAIEFAIKYEV